MHILLIYTGEFQTPNAPIGGIFQLNQAKLLSSVGIKTNILNPCCISPRYLFKSSELKRTEKINKVKVYKLYKKNIFPGKIKTLNHILRKEYEDLSLRLFKKYIKENGVPDICHVFDIRFGLVAGHMIKKKYKVPFIFSEYCVEIANDTLPLDKIYINKYVKPAIKECNYVALPSKKFSKKFKKFIKIKKSIKVMPPVIPPDLIKFNNNKNNKIFNFIIVSRLDKNKNVELPLKAFTKLKNENLRLTIIGDGPESYKIEKYLYDKRVILFKKFSRREMLKKLSNSDCIICSSFHETFGVGLVEAAFYGLPIISTKCEGPLDIVNKKNGLLISNKETSFKNAFLRIIHEKNKYKKNIIKLDIKKRFGHKLYVKNYINIYNQIKC